MKIFKKKNEKNEKKSVRCNLAPKVAPKPGMKKMKKMKKKKCEVQLGP